MNRNWIKIASIYIGTVIGAGFASGREIIEFFGIYGIKGIGGMAISGTLFAVLGTLLLVKIYNNDIESFDQLMEKQFSHKFRSIINIIMVFSLYTGFSVMVAGSGAIFKEELGLSFNVGILVMIVCSFIVFLFSLEGLSFANSLLVPLLIIGIMLTSLYVGIREGCTFSNVEGIILTKKGNFISSAILYFGSNSLIILVVFSSLLPLVEDKRTAILGGMVGGIILLILGISISVSMLIYYNEVYSLEVPMLKICDYIGDGYRRLYSIVLWIAMFTTALANGFGFMNRLQDYRNIRMALFCITTIPLAKLGFGNLIGIVYPIFGFIGFWVTIYVIVSS